MTDAITNIDLAKLHDAIAADIQAAFPDLVTVEFYREDRKSLPCPSCLLELTEFEAAPDADPGTEQQPVIATFEAQLVISFRTVKAKQSIRVLAGALAAWLHNRRWTNPDDISKKLPTGAAQVVGCYPDDFAIMGAQRDMELPQFEIWRVEWQQAIHLGNTVWTNDGETPTTPLYGWAPDIGIGHEDDYLEALPPSPTP